MSIESNPSTIVQELVEPRFDDEVLEDMIQDKLANIALFEEDPVLWLKASIAHFNKTTVSNITNRELFIMYSRGGAFEWDPHLSQAIHSHLVEHGWDT